MPLVKTRKRKSRKTRPIVRLENVKKTYVMGKVRVEALRGVSLEVYPGEFVGVWGPSGSGKSTLMNIIGCLDKPTSGRVFVEEREVSRLSDNALATIRGKKMGFVFQQFNLLPNLTALENVALPLVFQGVPRKKREDIARRLLEEVGLGDRLGFKPSELSGGQQQRVAIARALAVDPDVILADEPTGNVDTKTSDRIIALF